LEYIFKKAVEGYISSTKNAPKEEDDGEESHSVDYWLEIEGRERLAPCKFVIRPYKSKMQEVMLEIATIKKGRITPGWMNARPFGIVLFYLPHSGKCLSVCGHELYSAWKINAVLWTGMFGARGMQVENKAVISLPIPIDEVVGSCPSAKIVEIAP